MDLLKSNLAKSKWIKMNKILGKNEHLVIKEYKNYEHQVYVEELKDMKKFILNLIK